MTGLIKLFTGFLGGYWVYIAVAVAAFGAGSYAGMKIKATLDAPVISDLKTDIANGKTDLEHLNALVARAEAGQERLRADANEKAANEAADLQRQVVSLAAQKATADKASASEHQQLLKALSYAPSPTLSPDVPALDPALRSYADSLRRLQAARTGDSSPTRNPNP